MVKTQKNEQRTATKWLQWLLIVQIITLTHSALTNVVNFGVWNDWLKLALSAGVLFGLLMLRRQHKLYMVTVVLCGVDFLLTIVCKLILTNPAMLQIFHEWFQLDTPFLLVDIASKLLKFGAACSTVAFLFELLAHRSLVKDANVHLGKYWLWLTAAAVVLYSLMQVLALIVTNMLAAGTLNVELYQQMYPLLNLPGVLVEIAYAILLLQTGRELRKIES